MFTVSMLFHLIGRIFLFVLGNAMLWQSYHWVNRTDVSVWVCMVWILVAASLLWGSVLKK